MAARPPRSDRRPRRRVDGGTVERRRDPATTMTSGSASRRWRGTRRPRATVRGISCAASMFRLTIRRERAFYGVAQRKQRRRPSSPSRNASPAAPPPTETPGAPRERRRHAGASASARRSGAATQPKHGAVRDFVINLTGGRRPAGDDQALPTSATYARAAFASAATAPSRATFSRRCVTAGADRPVLPERDAAHLVGSQVQPQRQTLVAVQQDQHRGCRRLLLHGAAILVGVRMTCPSGAATAATRCYRGQRQALCALRRSRERCA